MPIFSGKYYNGTSSKPYACDVLLEPDYLVISLINEEGVLQEVRWDIAQISRTDTHITEHMALKYGKFPYQTLVVNDQLFPKELHRLYPEHRFARQDVVSMASRKTLYIILAFVVIFNFGLLAFTVIIPYAAESIAPLVPQTVEESIGEASYAQLTTLGDIDQEQSDLAQAFFDNMAITKSYSYRITVVDAPVVNAFALPGGRIVIFSGLLEHLEHYEELAALLAHESVHVEQKHSLRSIFRSMSTYVVISMLFGDMGGISAVVVQNLHNIQELSYSRDMEREADLMGLAALYQANIDPHGMIELFDALDKITPEAISNIEHFEFLSTHPQTQTRLAYLTEYIHDVYSQEHYPAHKDLKVLFGKLQQAYR